MYALLDEPPKIHDTVVAPQITCHVLLTRVHGPVYDSRPHYHNEIFSSTTPNYSLLAFPVGIALAILPHWYAIFLVQSNNLHGGWANEMPRCYVTQLSVRGLLAQKDKKLALTPLERTILRAEACQQNSFEHLPIFGVALLSGIVAKLPPTLLNTAAAAYVFFRLLYVFAYILVDSRPGSVLRTLTFVGSYASIITLVIRAALAFAS